MWESLPTLLRARTRSSRRPTSRAQARRGLAQRHAVGPARERALLELNNLDGLKSACEPLGCLGAENPGGRITSSARQKRMPPRLQLQQHRVRRQCEPVHLRARLVGHDQERSDPRR
jgi:hypothetical protein